jgi:hypothetical protein
MENRISAHEAAIVGSVVADSAAMGLHWIYDVKRIADVGGDTPEFHTPDASNYEGVVGVYAHDGRPVGSLTRYGATVSLITQHLAQNKGLYNPPAAAAAFLANFGYGGSFIGYVDHPAAGALDLIRTRDGEIEASFRSLTDRIPFHTIIALGPHIQKIASDSTVDNAEARISKVLTNYPDISLSAEQMSLIVAKIDDLHERYWAPTGVSDLQLPVLAPVIPAALAAAGSSSSDEEFLKAIRSAAHLTHIEEDALATADFVALLIRDLLSGHEIATLIQKYSSLLPGELAGRVRETLSQPWATVINAAEELGMSCALNEGLPLSLLILLKAENAVEAIRTNILCGGDSCGRGILIGALAGLIWGVGGGKGIPEDWIATVITGKEVRRAAAHMAG